MLALRINVDLSLLGAIWIVSISFFTVSVLLCVIMTFRRIRRNKLKARRNCDKQLLDAYIADVIRRRIPPHQVIDQMPPCKASVLSEVFLHYFRTLTGNGIEHLQSIICESSLEGKIIAATRDGITGERMRALKVLSYLPSQSSLPVIFEHLSSENKYVRLTSARGLVRRNALYYCDAIIDRLSESFPDDLYLLASILSGFGSGIIQPLETRIQSSSNGMVKAACLDAIAQLMPASTPLDLTKLAQDDDERVRAAALSLSYVAPHTGKVDPIHKSLGDPSVTVKMRAMKISHYSKRADLVTELFALSDDPVFWVRYWALKAIWQSGHLGRQFVASLADTNPMARNLELEMKSGYV